MQKEEFNECERCGRRKGVKEFVVKSGKIALYIAVVCEKCKEELLWEGLTLKEIKSEEEREHWLQIIWGGGR